jgi:NAD-dependent deacetylase
MQDSILNAAKLIKGASHLSAFTGAGISVESNIPPFRGENGLWNTYDPSLFEIDYYITHPRESWRLIVTLFYETFEKSQPNRAHEVLAGLEKQGTLKSLITQNIDSLHYRAGSRNIVEYHGNSRDLVCTLCGKVHSLTPELLQSDIPRCSCSGLLKPNFVFFGELIPEKAVVSSEEIVFKTDVMLVIGTTGSVYPAAFIPHAAKQRGALIVEINPEESEYTRSIADIFIQGPAAVMMDKLGTALMNP